MSNSNSASSIYSLSSIEENVQELPEWNSLGEEVVHVEETPNEKILSSRILLARWILNNDKIVHNAQSASFLVSYNNRNSLVELYPKEKCSCVQRQDCAHILAVKMSIGIKQPVVRYDRGSLTQLRRNRNNNVKTGRKMRGHKANSEYSFN